MRRTSARALLVAALFGGLAGWLVVTTAEALDVSEPQVPWLTAIALALAAVVIGVLARSTRLVIQVRRQRMEPQRAVTLLALGKASALAGTLVAAGYLVYGLAFVGRWNAELPRERVIRSAAAMVAGIALAITGLRLERACEVPPDADGDEPKTPV